MRGSKSVLGTPAKTINKILNKGIMRSYLNKLKDKFDISRDDIPEMEEKEQLLTKKMQLH